MICCWDLNCFTFTAACIKTQEFEPEPFLLSTTPSSPSQNEISVVFQSSILFLYTKFVFVGNGKGNGSCDATCQGASCTTPTPGTWLKPVLTGMYVCIVKYKNKPIGNIIIFLNAHIHNTHHKKYTQYTTRIIQHNTIHNTLNTCIHNAKIQHTIQHNPIYTHTILTITTTQSNTQQYTIHTMCE